MKSYEVKNFYDESTATLTYIVFDSLTRDAIVIDPVLDYDPAASKISTESINKLEEFLKDRKLNLLMSLETHAHADHLSGAQELKRRFPAIKIAIGERIQEVQSVFKKIYNLDERFIPNGSQFDCLLNDREKLQIGSIIVEVIFTPGHTPACASYLVGDALFTGDAIFMPDTGTGRCDFPGGSSKFLYHSIHERLYKLPDKTRVFVGHDYKGNGSRDVEYETTIETQKEKNIQLRVHTNEADYIAMRDKRDSTLSAPKLLFPSIQINIQAGNLPLSENNGFSYLKIPLFPGSH